MISLQIIRKIVLSLLLLLVVYIFKTRNEKKHKTPLIVDKDKIEEGEIIEEKK